MYQIYSECWKRLLEKWAKKQGYLISLVLWQHPNSEHKIYYSEGFYSYFTNVGRGLASTNWRFKETMQIYHLPETKPQTFHFLQNDPPKKTKQKTNTTTTGYLIALVL
jgi:hypothetical protein